MQGLVFFFSTTRNTARNAKIPGQKARILSCVSGRCFFCPRRARLVRRGSTPCRIPPLHGGGMPVLTMDSRKT